MKRVAVLVVIILLAGAGMYLGEKQKPETKVSPAPITHVIGDTERDLSRMPLEVTRLSDDEEIRIGNNLAAQYANYFPRPETPTDEQMAAYVQHVGMKVSAHAHRKLPYNFHYVPDERFVNAFALPGGHVFIGAGLIRLMDSEDQLGAVLGHEVEHVDHYHCAERVQVEARLRHIPLSGLVELPIELFAAGYSKEQELEADREGTRLAVMASYSPQAPVRLFETMGRLYREEQHRADTPVEEAAHVSVESLSEYFRSHPPTDERVAQLRNLIATEHWQDRMRERDLEVTLDPPAHT